MKNSNNNELPVFLKEYERWLASDKVDSETKAELKSIEGNEEEIKFRFFSYLEFGTAGLRGTMVAGTNAINTYTIRHATQGFANLINRENMSERGVVIAYDSRNNSKMLAEKAAEVMAANGIKVYIFDELRPTPVLSFSVRELNCAGGINLTASHNPKQYNGYKAYWEDGAQLSPEQADIVSASIAAADIFDDVRYIDFNEGVREGKIAVVGKELDEKYLENVLKQRVNPNAIPDTADGLRIVYTPLHGAGYRLVPEVLRRAGLKQLYVVPEQMVLDGNFPTVSFPNPEYPAVFELGIGIAEKVCSDLIIANDPDADRTGIMVRNTENKFVPLTGNQVGALLLDYIITAFEETGTMPAEPYAVKTIVTTELVTKICEAHNVKLYNVLTGFKFIGEVIKNHEELGRGDYIFGFEESYGYLKGTYARDKDAVVTSMLLCEMAAYYKSKNMTLYEALRNLFDKYGYYREGVDNIYMTGLDGLEKMRGLMERLRRNPPESIGGQKVKVIRDYLAETVTDLSTGKVTPTGLPKSNVLYYETGNGDVSVIRPSGTEPKIKIYHLIHDDSEEEAVRHCELCKRDMDMLVNNE